MRLPIDTTGLTFVALGAPEKVGEKEYHLQVTAIAADDHGELRLSLDRDPRITAGKTLEIEGLAAHTRVLSADSVQVITSPAPVDSPTP